MNKYFLYFLRIAAALCVCLLLCNCGKNSDPNDPDNAVPDPEGTVLVSMRNGRNSGIDVTPDQCYSYFRIDKDDNFSGYKFATIGAMKGIGNITKIPTSGWANKVSVVPGYGYAGASIGYQGVTFLRIYVVGYIEAVSGGVIGADVKYISPFHVKPNEFSVSKTVVNFPKEGGNEELTISLTTWSVSSSEPNWCRIEVLDLNKFRIIAYSNNVHNSSLRNATVTVKMEGLPDKVIQVTQAGSQ